MTQYIRRLLEQDEMLQDVWVEGELSNLSRPASGHLYFTLKDAGASIRCVMWRNNAARLRLALRDGLAVEAHGAVSVYDQGGQYQLYVDQILPLGEGALYQEFARLKNMLEAEGLFDPERKRPIATLPHRIGIVTSASGAALRDMLNTIRRRNPLVEVILAASPVQGEEAPTGLVAALTALQQLDPLPDVILMARGGGSIEDLWAFNDENVVRAVVGCKIPVVSGVGHETDFTLVDFAADVRAPTPTAAAELATHITIEQLQAAQIEFSNRIRLAISALLEEETDRLKLTRDKVRVFSPLNRIQREYQSLDESARRAAKALDYQFSMQTEKLKSLTRRLAALDPHAVLSRGYAMLTRADDGSLVSSVGRVKTGEALKVRVQDGEFDVDVQ